MISESASSSADVKEQKSPEHFFINIVLLNKDDIIEKKVCEKTGKGIFSKIATFAANKIVTEESIIKKMSGNNSTI